MVKTAIEEQVKVLEQTEVSKEAELDYPEYYAADTVEEAQQLLKQYGTAAKITAGGVDVVSLLKRETLAAPPKALVSLSRLSGLRSITQTAQSVEIGAMTRINDLERSSVIQEVLPMLGKAAHAIGGPQIRNMGTVAGNICQDVRCMYYRRPKGTGTDFNCRRKIEGGECYALTGENKEHGIFCHGPCVAPCLSDMAVALTALGAVVHTFDENGGRTLSVPELFTSLGKTLKSDEVITSISVPIQQTYAVQSFLKSRIRKAIDFAIVSVAATVEVENGLIKCARIAVGGVAPAPYRDEEAEQHLIGKPLTEELAEEAAEILVAKAVPLEKNEHKVQITRALVRRALMGEEDA